MNNWKDQLRKGNVIQTEFGILPICHISFGDFYVQSSDRKLHAKIVEPVKLTDELLLNFGFKKDDDGRLLNDVHNDRFSDLIFVDIMGDHNRWLFSVGCLELTMIKYVHQLQNLYWEVTGEQLEFIPSTSESVNP